MSPADYVAALRRLARDIRARNKRATVPVESGLAARAHQLDDPRAIEEAAAALEAAAVLPGRAADRARQACVAWAARQKARPKARPDDPFARELFERAARLAVCQLDRPLPPLSAHQRFVLDAVTASRATRGRDPLQRELAAALGVTPARVSQLLRRLRERGDLGPPDEAPEKTP